MTKYVVIKMSMENILIAEAPLTELTNRMGDWDAALATQSLPRIVAPPTRVTANGHHPGSTSSMKRRPAAQAAKPRSTHAAKNTASSLERFHDQIQTSSQTQQPTKRGAKGLGQTQPLIEAKSRKDAQGNRDAQLGAHARKFQDGRRNP